jgi:hypothetical protein
LVDVLLFLVSNCAGRGSRCNRKTACVILSAFQKNRGEIHQCLSDEIVALPTFLLHPELYLPLLKSGQQKLKMASAKNISLPKKKRIGKRLE